LSITKLGVIGVVAALLLAFGAFGLSERTRVAYADVTGVSISETIVDSGDTITATITSDDDEGGNVVINVDGGTVTYVSSSPGPCASSGSGTAMLTINAASCDGDTASDDLTITVEWTVSCTTQTTLTLTGDQDDVEASDSVTCNPVKAAVASVEVDVENSPVTGADITTLETNPVSISVSNADITITALDEDGNPVEGVEVLAIASTGVIETSGGVTVSSTTGTCSQTSDPNDTDVLHEEVNTDEDGEAVFTYCASVGSTLGPTTITFIVVSDTADEPDFIKTVSFTIVGPPASLTLTVTPTTLVCGEKATITGTVKDAIGQNVSNGTPVSLFTNFGGVAIGTSSGGGNFGGVATATTTSGNFNGFLLTSTTNTGPYEVVAQVTGAAGQAIFTQATVTCRPQAAAAPTVTAPSTGTGTITPPSTGDAGLLSSSRSDASLYVIAGMVAFVLAGFASLRFARR